MIALIPARAGSKRCPGKNTRLLNGHPLFVYTVRAALDSRVFSDVIVATDAGPDLMFEIPIRYGEGVGYYPRLPVPDDQPDIAWVRDVLRAQKPRPESFAILRPTSPFRTADTIRRAYTEFQQMADCGDSIRAVEPCPVNVYKCWTWAGAGMPIKPLIEGVYMPDLETQIPLHSAPSQLAPKVWIQNSSLEMAHTANVEVHGSIAGRKVGPFFTRGAEGFSIDTEADWTEAVRLAREHPDWLPAVGVAALSPTPQAQ